MSHSPGRVFFKDGTVLWFEYNGTVDVACSELFATAEQLSDHWRWSEHWPKCQPALEEVLQSEPVIIEAHYAGGFWWPGAATRTFRQERAQAPARKTPDDERDLISVEIVGLITDRLSPYGEEYSYRTDGLYQPRDGEHYKLHKVTGSGDVAADTAGYELPDFRKQYRPAQPAPIISPRRLST